MLKCGRRAGRVRAHLVIIILLIAGASSANVVQSINEFDIDQGTLESVQAAFGAPVTGSWGSQKIAPSAGSVTQDYCLHYGNQFFVRMNYSWVLELRIQSANLGYAWQDSVVIGSSLDDVFSEVGSPDSFVEGQPNGGMGGVFYRDIGGLQGDCYYYCPEKNVRFYFCNYRVSAIHLTRSDYGCFFGAGVLDDVISYQDVRWLDLVSIDNLENDDLLSLTYNSNTTWAPAVKAQAQDTMEAAKTPGLGVRRLHDKGLTGQGVSVGLIGEALWLDHAEYAGKIAEYHNPLYVRAHNDKGAGIVSLLVGETIGTAPHASLYYAACREGVYEVDYARSLHWIIRKNEVLSESKKIRVVAVAAVPGEEGHPSPMTAHMNWRKACVAAEEAGILVLDTTTHRRLFDACSYDLSEPDRLECCTPGYPDVEGRYSDAHLLVPTSQRTVAEQYKPGVSTYQYHGRHDSGWTTPYAAGVLALGWQVAPNLPGDQMVDALLGSSYDHADLVQIIHPQKFVYSLGSTPATYYVDLSAAGSNDGSSWNDAFNDLQDALARTVYGDKILVAEGIYLPDQGTGNTQGTFALQKGVAIEGGYPAGGGERDVQAYVTVLSGDLLGNDKAQDVDRFSDNSVHVVTASYTDENTILDGARVTAGYAPDDMGAGLFAVYGDFVIKNCVFEGNHAYQGGAMGLLLSRPDIRATTFSSNASEDLGGAVLNDQHSSPRFTHCMFSENSSGIHGGAMANCDYACDPILIQCTLANNVAENKAGGIYSWAGAPTLTHCIVWGNRDAQGQNESAQLQHDAGSKPVTHYCCIQDWSGVWKGQGNFSADPLFVDLENEDYHLKSECGHWDAFSQQWQLDTQTSPCIDAGDPELECQVEPNSNGNCPNLGAYGNSCYASKS